MSTDVYGGMSGAVADGASMLKAIAEWSVSVKGEPQAIVDSATGGGNTRAIGPKSWSGRYRGNGAVPHPLLFSPFSFIGSIDGTNGVIGNALFDSIKIDWDIAGGKPISHEVTFTGDGPPTFGAAVAADTSVQSAQPSIIATPVKLATPATPTETFAELAQVISISLELKRANTQPPLDSGCGGWKRCKIGPLDASLSIKIHPDSVLAATAFTSLPQPNSVHGVQLFVDATRFYLLDWMMFSDLSDIVVNRATGEAVSATLNAAMCGIMNFAGTDTAGKITGPSTSPEDIYSP